MCELHEVTPRKSCPGRHCCLFVSSLSSFPMPVRVWCSIPTKLAKSLRQCTTPMPPLLVFCVYATPTSRCTCAENLPKSCRVVLCPAFLNPIQTVWSILAEVGRDETNQCPSVLEAPPSQDKEP